MRFQAGLEYDERGSGEAVALVHAGVFSGWFERLFEHPVLDGFRVIRPVRPGYGSGPPPARHLTVKDHADRCGVLLRELGVGRAHWVGHSSSCCIGLQLALDDPELVASLILFEPARPAGAVQRSNAHRYVVPALAAAAENDLSSAFDVFLRGVGGEGYRQVLQKALGDDGVEAAVRESAYFFADELPAVAEWTFAATQGGAISAPTLAVLGSRSQPWFRENVELLIGMVPGAQMVVLEGADHLAPLAESGMLADVIAGFVRSDDVR